MKCEEFEAIGLDAERDASLSKEERAAITEHAGACSRCAALQDSWEAARRELRGLAEETILAQAPPRVEMRLRQEFRTQHVTVKLRRTGVIAAWGLAAAAVLVGAVSLVSWRNPRIRVSPVPSVESRNASAGRVSATNDAQLDEESLMADNFTLLPGALATDTTDASILRVRMQRSDLGALGLPVNEERATEWIQVDLLVGDDGLPQAVRLPQE
jgi:predicted anti-sigma-YlaC factor YlaD